MHLGFKIHGCIHNQYIWTLPSELKRINVIEGKIDEEEDVRSYWMNLRKLSRHYEA
jgi:hypothetical protein